MGVHQKKGWHAVVSGLHLGIYRMSEEADRVVTKVSYNKHKKFHMRRDAEEWLAREFHLLGYVPQSNHRVGVEYLYTNVYGHLVFRCPYCGEQ